MPGTFLCWLSREESTGEAMDHARVVAGPYRILSDIWYGGVRPPFDTDKMLPSMDPYSDPD